MFQLRKKRIIQFIFAIFIITAVILQLFLYKFWADNRGHAVLNANNRYDELTCEQIKSSLVNRTIPTRSNTHHDPELYKAIISPSTQHCTNDTRLIFIVISSSTALEHRAVYRATVLSQIAAMKDAVYTFLIGINRDIATQEKIKQEAEKHGDILQGNFIDSYNNLSIKSLFYLHWVDKQCRSQYVIKVDDDVLASFSGIDKMLQYNNYPKTAIFGKVFHHVKPIHDAGSKWNIDSFYNLPKLPTYVSGPIYVLSRNIVKPLYQAALSLPLIHLEDVYITGICALCSTMDIQYLDTPVIVYNPSVTHLTNPGFHESIHGYDTRLLQAVWDKRIQRLKRLEQNVLHP